MNRPLSLAMVVGMAMTAAAVAHPTPPHASRPQSPSEPWGGGGTRGGAFSDNFDSYAVGTSIFGQNGWEPWPGSSAAVVSDEQAASGSNSFKLIGFTDALQPFTIDGGHWILRVKTYVPSAPAVPGQGYVIICDQFDGGGAGTHWMVQIGMDTVTQTVFADFHSSALLPLVTDRWVEVVADMDIDSDTMTLTYDGQTLYSGTWTWGLYDDGVTDPGMPQIRVLDLFSNGLEPFYMDDVSMEAGAATCPADFDGSGTLTLADFVAFRNAYTSGNMAADFDGNGTLTLSDFVAFRNAYTAGCP